MNDVNTTIAFDQAHFGRTLRTAMARKGLTQKDLAEALETRTGKRPGQTTVSYWLRIDDKAQLPSIRLLPALFDALDLTCIDLFPVTPAREPGTQPAPLKPASPTDLVKTPLYTIKQGRLRRSRKKMTFDAQFAGIVPHERLGGLIVPAVWDHMIRYVRPGDRMMLDIYDPPASLQRVFHAGSFIDGVYVVAFTTGLKLYRLQELPGPVVAVLSDNQAYRDVELDLSAGDDLTLHARVLSAEGPA